MGSFALEEAGLRCLVTLATDPDGRVEGTLSLGDLSFRLRGRRREDSEVDGEVFGEVFSEVFGVVLDTSGRVVAQWRGTLRGERLRLELRLPESPDPHPFVRELEALSA